MALNDAEKERIRYHMGYLNVGQSTTISLGVPSSSQPQFILDRTMDNVLPAAEPGVRRCIYELDCIEDQMSKFRGSLEVKKTGGGVELRGREAFDILEEQYVKWAKQLGDTLGAPLNPFGQRLADFGAGPGTVVEPC